MATITVGLVNQSAAIDAETLKRVAAALDTQVKRDLKLAWDVEADVIAADGQEAVQGTWPIFVSDHPPGGYAGVHTRRDDGLPWAVVSTKRDWRLAASHELLEMLVDPSGEQTVPSTGIAVENGAFRNTREEFAYLLEVCDPIEDQDHAYLIDDVPVSDFFTPNYFDKRYRAGRQYSFNGSITRPREVRPGGYLSWRHPDGGRLQQLQNFGPSPVIIDLPEHKRTENQTLRMFVDQHTPTPRTHPSDFPPSRRSKEAVPRLGPKAPPFDPRRR